MIPLINVRETGINLRRIMDRRGITVKDVTKYLGLSSVQSVYHWLNGLTMPTIDNLYALSELLQVPIDDIVCGSRKEICSRRRHEDAGSEAGASSCMGSYVCSGRIRDCI